MSFIIQGRIEISISINGTDYPLDPGTNTLNFLQMGCSARQKLPTCHFAVTDNTKALDKVFLQDGIPLTIVVKANRSLSQTYNFRLFHKKKTFDGSSYKYEIDGYWDAPIYWAGTSEAGIQGTSSTVLQNIATLSGLHYRGITTNDPQLWMQRNRSYGDFAKVVYQHGYVSDKSYTVAGVDLTGTLIYVDANNLPTPTVTLVAYQMVDGMYTVVDYRATSKSGLNNNLTGYNNARYTQSQSGTALSTANDQLAFTPDTTAPLFNTDVKTIAARGYQSYGPIDVGNVHSKYERAAYQNMRYANLLSMDVDFLVNMPVPLTLFDKFTFSVETANNKQDPAYSGVYIVSGQALYVQGTTVAMKLQACRSGTDNAYTNG